MADTIESFVAKLQAEGVQAGEQEARKIRAEAEQQAAEKLQQAQARAEKIIADARSQAEGLLAKAGTQLDLAVRDAVLGLKEALSKALEAVLAPDIGEKLTDVSFLGPVLHDLILLYAKADLEGKTGISINVPPEVYSKLVAWAMGEIHKSSEHPSASVDLHGMLSAAGFEYSVSGATIEVTAASVVEMLKDLVGPELRATVDRAIAQQKK